jgi:glycerophosphoryl diester phosphodiesterase
VLTPDYRPIVIGHRGAPGYLPEHTAPSYLRAFADGVDAVEPDIVVSSDGVLVVRHENEISGTTNVADHPEFANRRTTKTIDGRVLTGWFTEDFTWDELSTLRARERLPELRPQSAAFDDEYEILRLSDLLEVIAGAPGVGLVAELKHPTYFASIGYDLGALFHAEIDASNWHTLERRLVVESFEGRVLDQLRAARLRSEFVYLLENTGAAPDEIAARGASALTYAEQLTAAGLAVLADRFDGISLDKQTLAHTPGLVDRAHAAGLEVFCWTLRPENRFLGRFLRTGDDPAAFGQYRAEWFRLMQLGLDGVFADYPDLTVAVRDQLATTESTGSGPMTDASPKLKTT